MHQNYEVHVTQSSSYCKKIVILLKRGVKHEIFTKTDATKQQSHKSDKRL